MKKQLLILMLFAFGVVNAQIVNIPDAAFKAVLLQSNTSNGIAKGFNDINIKIDANNDGEVQINEALAVYKLNISNNSSIHFFTGIEAFENIIDLKIDSCNQVEELNCTALTNLKKLTHFSVGGELLVKDLPNLETLNFDMTNFSELEIGSMPKLVEFNLYGGTQGSLDFSQCPLLDKFRCVLYVVRTLNLKNGKTTYTSFELDGYPDMYVCVDPGEELYILDDAPDAHINSYCSYTPGGEYNTITGNFTFDTNNNGCGTGDPFSNFVKVNITDGINSGATFSNTAGEYTTFTQIGNFTITPEFENDLFTATPPSATITLDEVDNSVTTQNFCVTANGVHPDVEVLIVPVVPAQPGFDAKYKVVYRNNGNQVQSGSVYFSFNDAVTDYMSSTPAHDTFFGNVLSWNYTNLAPFESRSIIITVNVNGPMEEPAVNIDDLLVFSAAAPNTGDETPGDNTFQLDQVVVGSFDPNDITCLEGEVVHADTAGDYLHYNINFENTGTAPATFIVVKDVIDTTQFDVSSLQVLDASHEMTVKVTDNKVEFRFDDINLGANEKGNIVFKVKTLNTLQVGDEVMNKAEIFFDYNWPIVTNEAVTAFEVLSRSDFEIDNSVSLYPNPATGLVNISTGSLISSIQLYDIQGRLLQADTAGSDEATIDMSSRAAGMYIVKVTTEKGVKVEKLVKE